MPYRTQKDRAATQLPDIRHLAGVAVAELELGAPDGAGARITPAPGGPPFKDGPHEGEDQRVFALVRLRGRPVGTVVGRIRAGDDPASVLAGQAVDEIDLPEPLPESLPGDAPRATVVVATRERPEQLARALDSLLAQDHPDFEIVVVDNAPATTATRDLVAASTTRTEASATSWNPCPVWLPPTTGGSPPPRRTSSPSPTTTSSPIRTGSPPSPCRSPRTRGSAVSPA